MNQRVNPRGGRLPVAVPPLTSCQATPMPAPTPSPRELVDRLDSRHEELLQKLDELNARIEQTLAEYTRSRDNPEYRQESRHAA